MFGHSEKDDEWAEFDWQDEYFGGRNWDRPRLERKRQRRQSPAEMRAKLKEPDPTMAGPPRRRPTRKEVFYSVAEADSSAVTDFRPTLADVVSGKNHMSKHEKGWIKLYLAAFYDEGLIVDVLRRVKGGKEATVYCCKASSSLEVEHVAGKVYKEREFRSLRNDAIYRQGRQVLDRGGKSARGRREALAIFKRSNFGQEMRHRTWLTSEYKALTLLHGAGVSVPKPYAIGENAILMEYIGEDEWPAPSLISVSLQRDEAQHLFEKLMFYVEVMLEHGVIHGDLSAYNVLYWEGEVTIIDFPQWVDPYANPFAYEIFTRDVERLCQYFARYGVEADGKALADGLWARVVQMEMEM